jgi:hypothetical protein
MFKSRSVTGHLLRGVLGFGFAAIALLYAPVLGWWTLIPGLGALVCFRGCPTCWTAGLIEAVIHRKTGAACVAGSCLKRQP